MSSTSALELPHLSTHSVHALLFKDVMNASFLRQQLIAGNADFEYAFLDASKILSMNHVLAAVFRAVNDEMHGRLKSRNVHSEIVFSLSPNNNIAESFRRFGIADDTQHVLAIKVITKNAANVPEPEPETHLKESVEGTLTDLNNEELRQIADIAQIRKLYKLDAPATSKAGRSKPKKGVDLPQESSPRYTNGVHGESDEVSEMEAVILGIMALKGS